jgi:hypothetical protein
VFASRDERSQQEAPGIQRSTPVFHAHINPEVNTIKKKKAQLFPMGSKVL